MAVSYRGFLVELYEEYLEDASFLFEQRLTLFDNPEINWKKIGGFEARLEAYIDGLIVGDKLALEVCKRRAAEGDFGELFTALSVFCRRQELDIVLTILEQLDPGDAEKTSAATDALKYELPEQWYPDFITLLEAGDPKLTPILARALGYRRVHCGPQLCSAMKRCATQALPAVVWAAGRIAYQPAGGPLLDYLRSEDEPVRAAAAVALGRMGEAEAIDYCSDRARTSNWPILPLALAGERRVLAVLIEFAAESHAGDCLLALGLLGDINSIPLLINRLEERGAATALECITGAGLYEVVFIPDKLDESETCDSQSEQLQQDKPLDRGDGRPFGSSVTRLSQNPEDWNRWWQANSSRFVPGVRYRNGDPYSPAALVDMLTAEKTSHELRTFCSEELVSRYGQDFGLETDMPVTRQVAKLTEAVEWTRLYSSRFEAGAWYFAGHRSG